MSATNFARCLAIGSKGEALFEKVLKAAGLSTRSVSTTPAARGKWDRRFLLGGRWVTAEVKYDVKASVTGNLAVEVANPRRGKDSGLNLTTADLWVFVLGDGEVWVAATAALREFVRGTPPKMVRASHEQNAILHIYRKDTLCGPVFTRIDHLQPEASLTILVGLVIERDTGAMCVKS